MISSNVEHAPAFETYLIVTVRAHQGYYRLEAHTICADFGLLPLDKGMFTIGNQIHHVCYKVSTSYSICV